MSELAEGCSVTFYKQNGHHQNIGQRLTGVIVKAHTNPYNGRTFYKLRLDKRHHYWREHHEMEVSDDA